MADKSQLAIEQQINQAIAARSALMEQNKAGLVDQIALAQELCRALECRELDGYQERMDEVKQGLMGAADASRELGASTEESSKAMQSASKSAGSWKAAGVGAFIAVKNVASTTLGIFGSIGNVIGSSVMGAFSLLQSGMQAWNGMIDGMLGMANELHSGTGALRQAMEDLRTEFGNLAKGEARAISAAFREISARGAAVEGTGLRMSRIFGSGSEGTAAKLKFFQEIATDMGPVFTRLSGDFAAAGKQIVNAAKGLGLSGKSIAALTLSGKSHGKTMKEVLKETTSQVIQVSKAYGTNIKVTGQMLDQMAQAPEIFGTDTKEMLKMSVAAQKLGVSIETLGKTTKVFDDFESGAKAAGELAAQFGVTVDAMDMMTATPAEQVTMLKDALQESGQSFEDMSRQEKARMAELTGMDMSELQNLMDPTSAFDMDAMGDVNDGVDAATKATMAQTKANKELVKVMERVIEQGQQLSGKGGLLGAFSDGVLTGIMNSKEFREILNNIRKVFKIVHRAGVQVGHMLGELFGPDGPLHVVGDLFNNLFNPIWISNKMQEVKGFFRKFVDSAKSGGTEMRQAFSVLVEDIVGAFFGGSSGGFADMMLQGLEDAFDFIGSSLISLLPYLMKGLSELFKMGLAALNGELTKPAVGQSLAKDGLFPMINEALQDPALGTAWDGLVVSFTEFIEKFWSEYGDKISDVLGVVLAAIIGAALIKSVGIIFASAMVLKFGKLFADGMTKLMGGTVAKQMPAKSVPESIIDLSIAVSEAIKNLAQISLKDLAKAGLVIVAIGAGFYFALKGMIKIATDAQKAGLDPVMLLAVAAGTYAVAKVLQAVVAAAYAADFIDKKSLPKLALILVGTVAVVAAIGLIMVAVMQGLSGVKPPEPGMMEAFGKVTVTILIATAAIAAIGAGLAILTALASGPQALILAAMIAGALVIFIAVAALVYMLVDKFGSMPVQRAKTAGMAAEAGALIIDSMLIVLAEIGKNMGAVNLDPEVFNKAVNNMVKIVDTIGDDFMPAMQRAANAITGDPAEVKQKLSIVTDMLLALSPIATMYEAALKVADMKGATPKMVQDTIDKLSAGVIGILDATRTMTIDMVNAVKNFSTQDVEKAAAVGTLITAVAGLLSNLTGPLTGFDDTVLSSYETQMISDGVLTDTYGEVRTDDQLGRTAGTKMLEFIENTGVFMTSIGAKLQPLIDAVLTLDLSAIPPNKLESHTAAVASIFLSLQGLMNIFDSLKDNNPVRMEARFNNLVALLAPAGEAKPAIWNSIERVAGYMAEFSQAIKPDAAAKGAIAFLDIFQKVVNLTNSIGRTTLTAEPADVEAKLIKMSELAGGFAGAGVDVKTFAPMITVMQGFSSLADGMQQMNWYDPNMVIDTIDGLIAIQPAVDEFATVVSTGMWEPLRDVLQAYNDMSLELGDAGNIVDISTTLNRVGQALKVDGQKVTVERGDVAITVNLSVNMQASTLSQVLVQNLLVAKGNKYKAPLGMEPPTS
jgi:hypothetical protein